MNLFQEIRRKNPLSALLSQSGVALRRTGSGSRSDSCPKCGHKKHSGKLWVNIGDNFCECFLCGFKGDVIDVLMVLNNMRKAEAISTLKKSGNVDVQQVRQSSPVAKNAAVHNPVVKVVIKKLYDARSQDPAPFLNYLCGERGIPEDILRRSLRDGTIGFLPSDPNQARRFIIDALDGEEALLYESHMLKEGKRFGAPFFRPMMWFAPDLTAIEFRLCRQPQIRDERKEIKAISFGNVARPTILPCLDQNKMHHYLVVEGIIDAWSARALGYQGNIMPLPGINRWKPEWFTRENFYTICFDGAKPGERDYSAEAADRLLDVFNDRGISGARKIMPPGDDINTLLKAKV